MAADISLDISQSSPSIFSGHLKLGGTNAQGRCIEFTNYYMLQNGKPCIPVMGEFHFSRYGHQFWEEELLKMKAGGIDIVATYVFWIHIEEDEGIFDWSGSQNLCRFLELCCQHGLQTVVRIGPFAHGECRNGGLPDWLYGRPFQVRSNDERYLAYVQRLYREIAAQLKGLLYKDGGCVIGIQLENEYMHCGAPWEVTFKPGTEWVTAGSDGAAHILKLKQIALDCGLDVPLYTCTGWLGSPIPEGEILPMQGGYAFTPWSPDPAYVQPPTREFLFRNRHLDPVLNGSPTYNPELYPLACCEIGGGIQDTYYHRNQVPPAAVEALAVVNLGGGANLIGYYMYHGGSNPVGKHSYQNEFTVPRISYDFQAPLREYGQAADSYRSLRLLHLFLRDFGECLAPMRVILPDNAAAVTPDNTQTLRYVVRSNGESGFLFLNNYQDHVEMQDIPGVQVALNTLDGTITVPESHSFTLEKNVSVILPFGLSLDGVALRYATAQLLSRIDDGETANYFFFAPRGIDSEYSFLSSTGLNSITVTPGLDSAFTLTNVEGKQIRVFTLTREQAERACKIHVAGQDRLLISDATISADAQHLYVCSSDQNRVTIEIFPPVTSILIVEGGSCMSQINGLFTRYTLEVPAKALNLQVAQIDDLRTVLHVPADALDGPNNIFLQVDYVGDIGSCFIDGKLVADNFNNGTLWELGLEQLISNGQAADLFFLITPIRKQNGVSTYVPTGMAFRLDEVGVVGAIHAITCVAEYRMVVNVA